MDREPRPRCQVTSLLLPGSYERPQASGQLTLLCPRAIVTCKRKTHPYMSNTGTREGTAPQWEWARTSDPPSLPPVPVMFSHAMGSFTFYLAVHSQGPGLLKPWVRSWRGAGAYGGGTGLPPALGVNEQQSGSCCQERDILIRSCSARADLGFLMNEDLWFN